VPVHEGGTPPPPPGLQAVAPTALDATTPLRARTKYPDAMTQTAPDPLALDRQLCFALAATSRSVIGLYRDLLEPMGLTHPQYLVMLALWERDPRSVREIAGELRLDSATLSPLLKRLEASGYVRRTRSAADERQLEVSLTTAGHALRDRAQAVPLAVADRLGWPLARLESLKDELTELLERVDQV
jgi:DNA-binding MarR family transcriptional regulator